MTAPDLIAAYPVDDRDLTALHRRLATSAAAEGLLDVAYRTVDSPVGALLLAATPVGLVRVAFAAEGTDTVLQELADRISPRVLAAPAALDRATTQLDEYFTGHRHHFDLDLDWRLSSGFRNTVLRHLATDVGYGHTASYRALADFAGNPKAVRAVGTACATNPIPVVVPCHRVIRSDGTIGNYLGGPAAKRTLLDLEQNS
ncbi:methylated-DNA--[protein]-cysteine S-methyltransferase [Actinoplanes sp. NPDC051411]|uniref:methylated-DNA--[protein]-cysteine S-methyltransferase n=1 Tax=Actinoplanes sp. NPDC051411 TaxID=3155522 RepID=UPI0034228C3D